MLPSCLLPFSCFVRAPSFREYVFICCGQIKWQGWCCALQNALRAVEFNFWKLILGGFCVPRFGAVRASSLLRRRGLTVAVPRWCDGGGHDGVVGRSVRFVGLVYRLKVTSGEFRGTRDRVFRFHLFLLLVRISPFFLGCFNKYLKISVVHCSIWSIGWCYAHPVWTLQTCKCVFVGVMMRFPAQMLAINVCVQGSF